MKILITVPNTGSIHKLVSFATDKILNDGRYDVVVSRPTHVPYENNLHHIVNEFMDDDFDFWLNIDSDNPPINNPLDLVKLDKDIIGLPTPVWHFTGKIKGERPFYENVYKYEPEEDAYTEWKTKEGLQQVDAVGTGCLLIARRVFEDRVMRQAPFQRCYNFDGTVERGNDISFCERAIFQGFKVWAHYDYRCRHFNNLEIHEVARAFYELYEGKLNG